MVRLLSLFLACCLTAMAQAAVELYEFDTASQEARYFELSEVLRCPKCQNQNLAGSNSQIAEDLRRELHRLLIAGKTDQEIKDHMVDRYGDFVLYRPPMKASTLILWTLPLMLLMMGFLAIFAIVRMRTNDAHEQVTLSREEQGKLKDILNR